ncbi:hypothetical protein FRB99_006911 [Tulasnella sp. 403]|nr:hypothetical protein FRB99_006911 [Tulasnella sp. 403]
MDRDIDSNEQESLTKHPIHYYEDGTIAFRAENTIFKVYKNILVRRSSVIRDMLSVPQPPSPTTTTMDSSDDPTPSRRTSSQDTFEGVPLITLHDTASDFASALDLIYPQSMTTAPPSLHTLTGLIRICNKYIIDDIRTWAIAQLESVLPLSADNIAKLDVYATSPVVPARVIALARECDLPQFLPLAFYALSTVAWPFPPDPDALAVFHELAPSDLVRVDFGRMELQRVVLARAVGLPENGMTEERCVRCSKGRPGIWLDTKERWTQLLQHPIEELNARLRWSYPALCSNTCQVTLYDATRTLRDELIGQLPAIFKLT